LTSSSSRAVATLAPIDPGSVASIRVLTTANNQKVGAPPSDSALARRFSMPFAVANAVVWGAVQVRHVDEPAHEISELAQRVQVEEDAEFTGLWPAAAPAEVTIHLVDGRTVSARCDNAVGTPKKPLSENDLRAKSAELLGDGGRSWDCLADASESQSMTNVLCALPALVTSTE